MTAPAPWARRAQKTPAAGNPLACPRCGGSNALHREPARLRCVYCAWQRTVATARPRDYALQRAIDAQLKPASAECSDGSNLFATPPPPGRPPARGRIRPDAPR